MPPNAVRTTPKVHKRYTLVKLQNDKLIKSLIYNDMKMVEVAGVEPASHDLS